MTQRIQPACRFLRRDEKIAGYIAAMERHRLLLQEIRRALPVPLNEHCLHASVDAGVLTLTTDSPVWSSRLRFFAPELERRIDHRYGPISSCRIRVQPLAVSDAPRPKRKLSPQVIGHLLEAAQGAEDAQIAAALRRLAKAGAGSR